MTFDCPCDDPDRERSSWSAGALAIVLSLLLALAGVLHPDTGRIGWSGGERPPLHVLGHQSGVKTRLSLRENLAFWQAVNGGPGIEPAIREAGSLAEARARRAGAVDVQLHVQRKDHIGHGKEGDVYLDTEVIATAVGRPRLGG